MIMFSDRRDDYFFILVKNQLSPENSQFSEKLVKLTDF
jgi:hypothetical protein